MQITIFWTVQVSALLVFAVPFRWAFVAVWAGSHFLRAIGLTLAEPPKKIGGGLRYSNDKKDFLAQRIASPFGAPPTAVERGPVVPSNLAGAPHPAKMNRRLGDASRPLPRTIYCA